LLPVTVRTRLYELSLPKLLVSPPVRVVLPIL
jgi:hypothetical protein